MKHTKCPANGKKNNWDKKGERRGEKGQRKLAFCACPNFGSWYFASGTGIRTGKQLFFGKIRIFWCTKCQLCSGKCKLEENQRQRYRISPWICNPFKLGCKCGIYHFCHWFPTTLPWTNSSEFNFSWSEFIAREWPEKKLENAFSGKIPRGQMG